MNFRLAVTQFERNRLRDICTHINVISGSDESLSWPCHVTQYIRVSISLLV